MIPEVTTMISDAPRAILTAEKAAEYLGGGIEARTLNRWAREQKLPAYSVGGGGERGRWRFRVADLDAWLESRRNQSQVAA